LLREVKMSVEKFEHNNLADALLMAGAWLARQEMVSVHDVVTHELYSDGFTAWEVVIYYFKRN